MKEQELLLIDAGAEYHGYTADITRTLPVDGSFSADEKAIYELVLAAQEAGIAACRAGKQLLCNARSRY
ncbi:MAG: M24 family metallopeptidase [Bacteroidetes bacterium]|nr:M24 family metallopeptidase [Bacteroidota bacterium]